MDALHGFWKGVLSVEQELKEDLANLHEILALKFETALGQPALVRPLFHHLRAHHPILVLPHIAIVSRHDDVLEVLQREDVFSVSEIYLDKMIETTGPFPLGMQDGPQYQREVGWMRAALHADDLERVRLRGVADAN